MFSMILHLYWNLEALFGCLKISRFYVVLSVGVIFCPVHSHEAEEEVRKVPLVSG